MYLKRLKLTNFKNYQSFDTEFSSNINCFIGKNGVGKTNILDAIYYLSTCKSFLQPIDGYNINEGELFFSIEGYFEKDELIDKVLCATKKDEKKVFKRNEKEYKKLSEHIGLYPVVIISPYDRNLIQLGSDVRRKFIDGVIAQYDKIYLADLLSYNKVVSQRNALLKFFAANRKFDLENLQLYNEKLIKYGNPIFEKRKIFIKKIEPIFNKYYARIGNKNESIILSYKSNLLNQNFNDLLDNSIEKDRAIKYTSEGIHKDDLNFLIDGYPIKKRGSQGQQKSFLIALKLAQFEFMKTENSFKPILLLDDIFDKLDSDRVEEIVKLVNDDYFGQIFITDTHPEHIETILIKLDNEYRIFMIENAKIIG